MSATPATVPGDRQDVTPLPVPGQDHAVRAWLVTEGDDPGWPRPAVLWLHWLGRPPQRPQRVPVRWRSTLAGAAVSSRCYRQGHFPWVPDPDGTAEDVTAGARPGRRPRGRARPPRRPSPAVDPARIALVGHDYGAMYGALLADRDERVSAGRLRHRTRPGGNWFATYWLAARGTTPARSTSRGSPGLDPVEPRALGSARTCCSSGPARTTFVHRGGRATAYAAQPGGADRQPTSAPTTCSTTGPRPDLVAFLAGSAGARPKLKHVLVLRPCDSPTPRR